jgi:uncharacterized DUF497 family protein
MRYSWDERKAAANLHKHGIGFTEAVRIFDGEILHWPDERYHYGEERWIAIGIAKGQEVFVVYVEEGEEVRRILSARPATRRERALYWRTIGQQD